MKKITTVLVDDEKIALVRMEGLLNLFPHISVLATEQDPNKAIQKIVSHKPDIVFIDIEMPVKNGFEVISEVRKKFVFPEFIFVTAYNHYAIQAIKTDAFDFLLKPVQIGDIKESLQRIDERLNHFPKIEKSCLSKREKEVAILLCKGKTSQEIAELLFISKNTADTHRRKILEKLNLKNTGELIIFAR